VEGEAGQGEEKGAKPAPPPASFSPVGRRRAARGSFLSSEGATPERRSGAKGYAGAVSTRFRGQELGNCCGRLTRAEAVPWNLVWFPGFNSESNPNGGNSPQIPDSLILSPILDIQTQPYGIPLKSPFPIQLTIEFCATKHGVGVNKV
jgi:hypothetical protein